MATRSESFAASQYAAASAAILAANSQERGMDLILLQAPRQVCLQVFPRLEANRDPHQPLGDAGRRARLRRDAAVGGGGRVRDGALDVAEVAGDGYELGRVDHRSEERR